MKIKEILFDYTNPIDIPTKNLADDANTILDNFKKALHDNVGSPYNKMLKSIQRHIEFKDRPKHIRRRVKISVDLSPCKAVTIFQRPQDSPEIVPWVARLTP